MGKHSREASARQHTRLQWPTVIHHKPMSTIRPPSTVHKWRVMPVFSCSDLADITQNITQFVRMDPNLFDRRSYGRVHHGTYTWKGKTSRVSRATRQLP